MDGTASTELKAPSVATAASESSVSVKVVESPAPLHAADKVESSGEEDEQVERFFKLLSNIRALRTMYGATAADAACRGRKRARDAEPPWKPAFRLEDFEEQQGCAAGKKTKMVEGRSSGKVLTATSTDTVAVAVADVEKEDDGEVVETSGAEQGPSGHCVQAPAGDDC